MREPQRLDMMNVLRIEQGGHVLEGRELGAGRPVSESWRVRLFRGSGGWGSWDLGFLGLLCEGKVGEGRVGDHRTAQRGMGFGGKTSCCV